MCKAPYRKQIPIVYAADRNYFFYTIVSITSLAESAKEDTFYTVKVLVEEKFYDEEMLIEQLCNKYSNIEAELVTVDTEFFSEVYINNPHISKAAFYRLAVSDYVQESKCIYLDSDTIVTEDLQELWDYELDDFYIAGCRDIWIDMLSDNECEKRRAETGLPGMEEYINSGVLIFNLERIRKKGLNKVFTEHLKKNYPYEDQDILNVCCYHHILRLPDKWNNFTAVLAHEAALRAAGVTESTISHYKEVRGILHYISKECRPWEGKLAWRNWYWWQTAEKWKHTRAYAVLNERVEKKEKQRRFKACLAQYSAYENLVIWGFTPFGRELCDQLLAADLKCRLYFCDKDNEKQKETYRGIEVISPKEAFCLRSNCMYLIVSKRFAEEIRTNLLREEIAEEDIQLPVRKDTVFYRTLDERYYQQELQEIFLKEGICVSERQQWQEAAKHKDWNDKYYMEQWILREGRLL